MAVVTITCILVCKIYIRQTDGIITIIAPPAQFGRYLGRLGSDSRSRGCGVTEAYTLPGGWLKWKRKPKYSIDFGNGNGNGKDDGNHEKGQLHDEEGNLHYNTPQSTVYSLHSAMAPMPLSTTMGSVQTALARLAPTWVIYLLDGPFGSAVCSICICICIWSILRLRVRAESATRGRHVQNMFKKRGFLQSEPCQRGVVKSIFPLGID